MNISYRLKIAWDMSNFIDETSRLLEATGESQFAPVEEAITGGQGIIDTMTLVLANHDNRFSPLYTSSPLYSYLQNGKSYHAPVYLEVSIDGGSNYYRIFTGVIKLPKLSGANSQNISQVEIECRARDELLLQCRLSTTLSDFQSSAGYNESQLIELWLTQAGVSSGDMLLDPGLFSIGYAWLDDESPLEEIWSLAASCGGRFYASPDGKYVYENSARWVTSWESTAAQETIGADDYDLLTPYYADGELYDVVTVESSGRIIAPRDVLWEPDEEVVIPPATTKKIVAKLRQPAWLIDSIAYAAVTAGGTKLDGYIELSTTPYAQRVDISISNTHTTHAAYLRPLRITGQAIDGAPSHEETRTSALHGTNAAFFASRGSRTKPVRASAYVQSRAHAGTLAHFLLRRYEIPRLGYAVTNAVGKPQRRLGNRITISDTTISDVSRDAILTGIRWSLDRNGFNQDLTLIDAGQLYPFYPTPGYITLGSDTIGGSEKLFF